MANNELETVRGEPNKNYTVLGVAAIGSIEAHGEQSKLLDELVERIQGKEFLVSVTARDLSVPAVCVDGRLPENYTMPTIEPSSAGGTMSLLVADDLTNNRYSAKNSSTADGLKNILSSLETEGLATGGHIKTCGMINKLPEVYNYIIENPNVIRSLYESLGFSFNPETHDQILTNAIARTEFSSSQSISDTLQHDSSAVAPILHGEHNEFLVVINKVNGTTIDRVAISKAFNNQADVFVWDAWSSVDAGKALSDNPVEQNRIKMAIAYTNIATLCVLCGPNLGVVTLE